MSTYIITIAVLWTVLSVWYFVAQASPIREWYWYEKLILVPTGVLILLWMGCVNVRARIKLYFIIKRIQKGTK